ncbi:hypothetical protein C0991_001576, partial [Blastosporella zonata]
MRFSRLVVLAALTVSSLCTSPTDVHAELTLLASSLKIANTAITALSPTIGLGTTTQLLTIRSATLAVIAAITTATAATLALSPSPVSDTDGRAILNALKALEPGINDSAAKLAQRVTVIAALPTIPLLGSPSALARADLQSLKIALNRLEDAARAAAP